MFKILKFWSKAFFIKLFKGQYSIEYVSLFKNNDLRSPFLPCIKDEFIFHILMFLKRDIKVKKYTTTENIQFGNTSFSLNYTDIFKTKGVPMCFNALKINDYVIKIIGYQDTVQDSKIKLVYYFVNDIFILGEYSFSDNSLSESVNISKILIDKYISESTKDIDEFYIEDSNKNCIYFKDNGFERSVKYFNYINIESRKIYEELTKLMLPSDMNNDDIELKLSQMF